MNSYTQYLSKYSSQGFELIEVKAGILELRHEKQGIANFITANITSELIVKECKYHLRGEQKDGICS